MGEEKDLPPGRRLVEYFRSFAPSTRCLRSLSAKTIRRHVVNMWLLGGEIIRDVNENSSPRKAPADKLVRDEFEGGPLIHNGSEDEQRSFDSTCRKFHRFLTQTQS